MVEQTYGMQGKDLSIGVKILTRAATPPEFAGATGRHFDNGNGQFRNPHPDALDPVENAVLVEALQRILNQAG